MRRRITLFARTLMGTRRSKGTYDVGDIVLYDKVLSQIVVVDISNPTEEFLFDTYIPISVIVIPSSHDVYGTGEAGSMSLLLMSYTSPDKGSNDATNSTSKNGVNMYFGNWGQVPHNTFLPDRDKAVTIGRADNQNDEVTGMEDSVYLPFDKSEASNQSSSQYKCKHNTNLKYGCNNIGMVGPSPYLQDWSRNPMYYQTSTPASESNCLADFNGKYNTEVFCELATSQPDWKTASVITNLSNKGYLPMACVCYRFNPDGMSQGQWYLPAAGEVGYVVARYDIIRYSMRILKSIDPRFVISITYNDSIVTSTERGDDIIASISLYPGSVSNNRVTNTVKVRAFRRIA